MIQLCSIRTGRQTFLGVFLVAILVLTGCDRGEVASYEVPKEASPVPTTPMSGAMQDPHAGLAVARPSLTWGTLPAGWTQEPQSSGMRLASFSIAGEDGQSAELAIIPMSGFAGTDDQLVNMWRVQLGLSELAESEAGDQGEALSIGGDEGTLYEMAGNANDVDTRILVASVNKDGVNYFFKLIGHDATVAAQKQAFLGFLSEVNFSAVPASSAPASGMVAAANMPGDQPWTAPQGWTELPATQFLLAKYQVPGEGDAVAEVTVSKLGGTAGGLLPNVNRWRGQLNLGPVDEAGLAALMSEIKAGSADATLVELEGTDLKSGVPARMLTVIVSLPDETWFFKMMGPIPVMDEAVGQFRSFINATRF